VGLRPRTRLISSEHGFADGAFANWRDADGTASAALSHLLRAWDMGQWDSGARLRFRAWRPRRSTQRGADTGAVRLAIGDRRGDELRIVAETAQAAVAFEAEQPAHEIGPVVMVDAELALGLALADGADTVLRAQHGVVVVR
jgi:hypothetical protein